jgi:hypothetical protein
LTADKLVEDTTVNNSHDLRRSSFAVTSGSVYTVSIYAKANERSVVAIFAGFSSATSVTLFNLSTGLVHSVSANATAAIQNVGNGWYRCSITVTANSTSGTVFYYLDDGSFTTSYTGDGTSGLFLWGAQIEVGAFATSYIPSVASQVTRAADNASMIGNNFARWYNVNAGTLYSEYINYTTVTGSLFSMDDGSINNRIIQFTNTGTNPYFRVVSGGADQANFIVATVSVGVSAKFAAAYQVNDFAASVNGASVAVDTSGNVPTGLTTARIGQNVVSGAYLNGNIARIAYYNRRLANTELTALTS